MHEVILHFHDRKHAHHLLKKLSEGKGVVVRPEHLGGGWLNSLANNIKVIASNPQVQQIAKDVGKKALDKGIDMAVNRMQGQGLLGNIGNVLGNALDDKFGIGITHHKRGRPRKHSHDHDGDGLFGNIGNALGNTLDDKFGIGMKPKRKSKKGLKQSRAMELYNHPNGGSMVAF